MTVSPGSVNGTYNGVPSGRRAIPSPSEPDAIDANWRRFGRLLPGRLGRALLHSLTTPKASLAIGRDGLIRRYYISSDLTKASE